jgi:alkanesulfonate monooxygenase SsuD/methylene tetrahydromethanopterin reductase-like flavin-dependent oxidoreductase (luciferase family)
MPGLGGIGAVVSRHYSAVMAPIAPAAQRLAGLGICLGRPDAQHAHDDVLDRACAVAVAAERVGFTSVWVTETSAEPPDAVPYEAFSLVSALAVRTGTVHLGVAVDGDQRRAPSILAKIVTSLDVISHGRAVLSLDADRSDPADADRLDEALAVARAVLEDEHPTVEGRIYSVADAVNRPAPVQPDGVPLVVFLHGTGPGVAALEVCARSADAVVVTGGVEAVREAASFVEGWPGERARPGDRVAVLGRAAAAADVAAVRAAGADGCLVGVTAPWSAAEIEGLGLTW